MRYFEFSGPSAQSLTETGPRPRPPTAAAMDRVNGYVARIKAGASIRDLCDETGFTKQAIFKTLEKYLSPDDYADLLNTLKTDRGPPKYTQVHPCAHCGKPTNNVRFCSRECSVDNKRQYEQTFHTANEMLASGMSLTAVAQKLDIPYHRLYAIMKDYSAQGFGDSNFKPNLFKPDRKSTGEQSSRLKGEKVPKVPVEPQPRIHTGPATKVMPLGRSTSRQQAEEYIKQVDAGKTLQEISIETGRSYDSVRELLIYYLTPEEFDAMKVKVRRNKKYAPGTAPAN